MSTPWYDNLSFANYGVFPDPNGPYPKPDLNFCNPAGTPITALQSGVVTSVMNTNFGGEIGNQPSVTVQMDNPPNSDAKYAAYNYLGSANVQVGQHVNFGDTIGTSLGRGVCTAYAWTNSSPYGSGDFTGKTTLDPTNYIKTIQGGVIPPNGTGSSTSPSFLVGLTEHAFIFIIAITAIIMGFLIMTHKPQPEVQS